MNEEHMNFQQPPHHQKKRSNLKDATKFIAELLLDAIIIVSLVVVIRLYLMAPFHVHGTSMCNTLNYANGVCNNGYGEYLIISKLKYAINQPERGDIVVFRPPGHTQYGRLESLLKTLLRLDEQEFFIKRIIGLPGETVELKNGHVYITNTEHPKGFKLRETYLSDINQGNTQPLLPGKTTFVVPKDRYLVFGDNRAVSTDARSCFKSSISGNCNFDKDAYLSMDQIEGRASIILFPIKKIGLIKNPTFD